MKRLLNFLTLTILITLGSLTIASCEKEVEAPLASIELKAKEAQKNSVSFIITATDATEIAYQVIKGAVQELPSAETVMNSGKVFPSEGTKTYSEENLETNTLYSIFAAARNADNIYTDVAKIEMTTLELCNFTIEVTETLPTIIKANVTCSDPEIKYLTMAYPSADLEGKDDDQIHEFIMNDLKAQETELSKLFRTDFSKCTYDELNPATDYTIIAFAADENGARLSGIERQTTKTTAVKKSDITFEVSTEYTHAYGTIITTPSRLDEKYVYVFAPKSEAPEGASTAEELANAYIKAHRERLDLGKDMVTGVQTYEGELTPETSYYVLAFAYEYGITSEIKFVEFTTPVRPYGPEDLTFDVELLKVEKKSITVKVKPNVDTLYYAVTSIDMTSTKTIEENIEFEKGQVLTKIRRKPIEEAGLLGEQEYTTTYRYKGDAPFSIIVFGIWKDEADTYHATEMTHIEENAFVAPPYFATKVGEPRVVTVPDGPIHTKSVFEVDVEVEPIDDYYSFYMEAIPTSSYTAETLETVLAERQEAFRVFCNDPANLLEGEKNAKDVVKRLAYYFKDEGGIGTVTMSEQHGITEPNTEYTLLIWKVSSWGNPGVYSIVEKAFTTPMIAK